MITKLLIGTVVATSLLTTYIVNHYNTTPNTTVTLPAEKVSVPVANVVVNENQKTVENLSLDPKNTIYIDGEIGERSESIAQEITKKSKNGKPLYILIASPGGSVMDGALIISAIQASKVPVYTVCKSLCASMAAIIHQYGTKRLMVDRAILMFHPAAGGVRGSLEEMQSLLGTITLYVNRMDNYIAKRANLSPEVFHNMWVSQLWMDAETSMDKGFADGLVNLDLAESNSIHLLNQKNEIKEKFNISW